MNNSMELHSVESLEAIVDSKHTCRRCGALGVLAPSNTIHLKVVCPNCLKPDGDNLFIGWQSKPKEGYIPKRKTDNDLILKYSKGFCELCLIKKEDLIPQKRTLEVHHVIPVKSGGSDESRNLQILCTGCHKLIHCIRTYKIMGNGIIEDNQDL